MYQSHVAETLLETLRRMKSEQLNLAETTRLSDLDLDSLDTLELFYAIEPYIPEIQENPFNIVIPNEGRALETGVEASSLLDVLRNGTVNDLAKVVTVLASQKHNVS